MEARQISADGAASLSMAEIREAAARDGGMLWLDFDHTDEDGMAMLGELIDVKPSDVQECHNRSPVPKMRFYADHHFSAINGLARGSDGRLYFQPLKLFLTSRTLVTVLGPTSSSLTSEIARRELATVRQRIDAGQLRPASPFELVGAIRAEEMRTHEDLITDSSGRIAQLERDVSQKDPVKAEGLLQDLFDLRHDLEAIRTSAAQAAESFTNLIETMDLQEGLMQTDLRLVRNSQQGFRHLQHTADLEREYLQEMIDLFQTRVSTELNRFVRKVTAWGTVGIAWTVIVGLYGMNFTYMPELGWRWGYPTVLVVMLVVGILLVLLFRRRGWL
jgi:magnesium/cobalt transport protein CorA